MRCLFVAVAAQRFFLQPSLPANPSYANMGMMTEVQSPYATYQPVVMQRAEPGAADWINANPITSCVAVAGLAFFATNRLVALGVIGRPATATPRADIEMNTQYAKSVFDTIGRKKNPKTGDSLNLKGYTVGSRAPKSAVSSGTINQFGYGIGNLYGGSKRAPAPSRGGSRGGASSGGAIDLSTASPVGLFGVALFGALVFYAFAVYGGGIAPLNVQ
jgi:hypothetical protein